MTQHTPEPWTVVKKGRHWVVRTLKGYLIAHVLGREADARLIAAAPDLLDELKQLVDLLGRLPENARGDVQGFDVNHAFSRASKLLASLEGQ